MPAIPKPASTVVLMDDMNRIYLTKRPDTMKFMGGFYVFPGGAVEVDDEIHNPSLIDYSNCEESFCATHYVAAVRELFEEVGIFLGERKDGSFPLFKRRTDYEYRQLLMNGEIKLSEIVEIEELYINLQALQYYGHIITPVQSPIRFDTRFFLAKLPQGQFPVPDPREVADAFWITPEEALNAYMEERIPMAPPTVISLKGIYYHLRGEPLRMPKMPIVKNFKIQDFKL